MPFTASATDGVLTPNRTSWITFDVADYVLTAPGMRGARSGAQIARDKISEMWTALEDPNSTSITDLNARIKDMQYWPGGFWSMRCIQQELTNLNEYTLGASLIVDKSRWRFPQYAAGIVLMESFPLWRANTDLPGMVYDTAAIAAQGDNFLVKRIKAGSSWNPTTAIGTSLSAPPFTTLNVALDRCGETTSTYPADQGFFLRWTLPGTQNHHPNYVGAFYFGQYAVSIKGNGYAVLWEYCHDVNNAMVWRQRDTFQYCRPSVISDDTHTLLIHPGRNANGQRIITFQGGQPEGASYFSGFAADNFSSQAAPTHHIYVVDEVSRGGDKDESPGSTTKQDIIRFDIRRDLKLTLQISTLAYAKLAYLADLPLGIYDFADHTKALTINTHAAVPSGTTLTVSIRDTEHYPTVPDVTSGTTIGSSIQFTLNTSTVRPGVIFNFSGNGNDTPRLYSYSYNIQPTADTGSAIPFTVKPSGVNIEGLTDNYTEVGGNIAYDTDYLGEHNILSRRGQFAVGVYVRALPTVTSTAAVNINLFRGYGLRPLGKKVGKFGQVYPNEQFYRYQIPIVGMYYRLTKRLHRGMKRSFLNDPNVPFDGSSGVPTPYKATTAIQELILDAGFPLSQINIGPGTINDIEIRLWYGTANHGDDTLLNPQASYGDLALRFATDYLYRTIYWHDQMGYWDLLKVPVPDENGDYTPVFTFQLATDAQLAGQRDKGPVADPRAWGNFASKTFIINEFGTLPIPPEFNIISVACPVVFGASPNKLVQVVARIHNFNSYKVPGSTVDPDPDHPDYLGTALEYPIVDTGCTGTGDSQGSLIDSTFRNCLFKCRRLFEQIAHGRQNYQFEAPLVFIQATATTLSGTATVNTAYWRPLRYLDAVTVPYNGTSVVGFIRSVSPDYTQDQVQTARYEVIVPRTGC